MLHEKLSSITFHYTYEISKGFEQKLASFGLKPPFKDQMVNQMATAKLSQAEPSWAKLSQAEQSWAKVKESLAKSW